MANGATRCTQCETPIVDPTTQVVHGGQAYCCANCSAVMEQTGSGSDAGALGHAGDLRCAHCGVPIVHESTMESRGDEAFCCPNCAVRVAS